MNKKIFDFKSVILVLVAAIFLSACGASANAQGATNTAGTVGEVATITISDTIETSGTLDAEQLAKLMWNTSGIVDEVKVKAGQKVKQGDILATLKSETVPASIISAQSDLATAKSALEEVKTSGASKAEADLALVTAKETYEDARNDRLAMDYKRATDEMIKYSQAQYDSALNNVDRAQDQFNSVKDFAPNDPRYTAAYTNLYNAKKQANSALATLNWYLGKPTEQDIAEADANLALAQAQLDAAQAKVDRMVNGYDPEELAAAQAKVDAAQSTVNSMYIISPFDGEVLAVETMPNSLVSNGDSAIVVVNPNTLKVEAPVDETDIYRVSVGNAAEITMDSLPDTALTGKVTLIDPIGSTVNGLVKYTVIVAVEPDKKANLFGGTADVTLITSDPRTMLAVPLGAVQNDTNGEYVLRYMSDGSLERVEVVSDTVMDDMVSITGDLKEGDKVFVGTVSNSSDNQNNFPGGGPGGGGMPLIGG